MKTLSIIMTALMLLTACQKESDESSVPSSSNSGQVSKQIPVSLPFQATLNAAVNVNSTNPPTGCSGDVPFAAPDFLLSGTGTYLGQMNAQLSGLHHISCDVSAVTMLLTTHVSVDLVAADGAIIHCTGDDVVNVASLLTQTGTTGAITGTWTVTGGTGRFNGVSGSLTINGLVDFVANTFSCNCAGTISY